MLKIIFVGAFIDRPICVFVLAHAIAFPIQICALIKIAIDENVDTATMHFAVLQQSLKDVSVVKDVATSPAH